VVRIYTSVCVPEKVVLELDAGRLLRSDTIEPRQIDRVKVVPVSQKQIDDLPPNKLGIGEHSVIAYAKNKTNFVLSRFRVFVMKTVLFPYWAVRLNLSIGDVAIPDKNELRRTLKILECVPYLAF